VFFANKNDNLLTSHNFQEIYFLLHDRKCRVVMSFVDPDQPKSLAYTQGGSWISLVNVITWTLASVYILGSFFSLQDTLKSDEYSAFRLIMPIVWLSLCIPWVVIDKAYLDAAKSARATLRRIEEEFPNGCKFYTEQPASRSSRVSMALYATAGIIFILWLCIFLVAIESRVHPKDSLFKKFASQSQELNKVPGEAPPKKPGKRKNSVYG
jgi:hypothetical protein